MKHSYIVELKYAKYKDPETRVEELRREAIAQADRYACLLYTSGMALRLPKKLSMLLDMEQMQ